MSERDVFTAALEMTDPAARSAYLDQACAGDGALRQRVEMLLGTHGRAGDFLEQPVVEQMAGGAAPDSDATAALVTGGRPERLSPPTEPASDDEKDAPLDFLQPSTKPGSLGRLGHYEVLEVIGRGGFGIVLRAFDEKLHRVVAVKVMAPQLAATSPARKRFLREARAAAAVRHDNVVAIYNVEEQPIPYLVMEFIAGETLQQKLDRVGPLDASDVVRIGRQIAEGLAGAHTMGLIHRDVKPSNILLESGAERVKITDFGLARAADDASLTQSGVIAGTPMYMAPEQARGETIDHRADLFSLGSVMYQMCTGRPPFRASTTFAVLKRVAEDTPRPMREIIPEAPEWLCAIIAKLHAKGAEDRFPSAQCVADLLGQHLGHLQQPTLLPRQLKVEAPKPPLPRRRGLWVAGAAVLLLLLLALAGFWLGPTILGIATNKGTLTIEAERDIRGVRVLVLREGQQVTLVDANVQNWALLEPGVYQLQLVGGWKSDKAGGLGSFSLSPSECTLSPGERLVARVRWDPTADPKAPVVFRVEANRPWQDTGVDVAEGEAVVLSPQGSWRKGEQTSSAAGLEQAPRERAVWPELPLLCLLARIGDEPPTHPVRQRQVIKPTHSGRLFVQTNDLDLEDNGDSLQLTITGGLHIGDAAPPLDLLPVQAADPDWKPFLARVEAPGVAPEQVRDAVFNYCQKYPGAPQTFRAGQRLLKIPPLINSIGMKLAPIPPGKFLMGSPDNEPGREAHEGAPHEVVLTRPFYMGVHDVTVGQFKVFVKETGYQTEAEKGGGAYRYVDGSWQSDPLTNWRNPGFEQTDDHPVVCMSWNDANAFCNWLSQKEKRTYQLPTEAQWEYACRAGTTTAYSFGDDPKDLGDYAWYQDNSGSHTHAVGGKKPNPWGLYDMHGSVLQWCQDYYVPYPSKDVIDPLNTVKGSEDARVLRGGSWDRVAWGCLAACRGRARPDCRYSNDGMRVCLRLD